MPVTSWLAPTNTVSSTSITNPDNVFASDDAYAEANGVTDQAVWGSFGDFSIPAGVTITGIELRVEGHRTSGVNNTMNWGIYDGIVYRSKSLVLDETTDSYKTVGGDGDLWGGDWSVADFADGTFTVKMSFSGVSVTHSVDIVEVRVYYAYTKSHTTDVLALKPGTKSHTTDVLAFDQFTRGHTTDVYTQQQIGVPTWVSPADTASISTGSEPLVFVMPNSVSAMHFELQIDTVNTFDSGDLQIFKSWLDQTNWEYWNGSAWTAWPAGGVDTAYIGNQARYTPNLSQDTYYRRIRGFIYLPS